MATRLTDAERAGLAQTLPGWSLVEGRDAIERASSSAIFPRPGAS